MKRYIGTKLVNMKPMTRGEYNAFCGWQAPEGEAQDVDGYLVEYLDGGAANTPDYAGYVSWTPKEQADAAYRQTDGMTFGLAVEALKKGFKVARTGWNGKGMFVYLVPGSTFAVNRAPLLGIYPEGTQINYRSHMDLRTADGSVSTWAPSGSDALAEDWEIVE
jgi:hypothetical protein